MKTNQRTDYLTRDSLMKLLSDEEVAKVSTAETAAKLADGEEYVDLEQLTKGVQRSHGAVVSMGTVLPRSAVHEQTWSKIVTQLQAPRSTAGT
ncbi:MAG: hypothetical protein JNK05_38990 [Myxococcales bacterium]|nr:hypothetical protein [Myxococcales bacterium]